jgi:DNA-binding winged helix-turn-helix (wHTH) protein
MPRYIETLPRRGYRWINTIPLDARPSATVHMPHNRAERIEIVWA